MQACIVGHGPSMIKNSYGKEIDDHDKVIRMKKSTNLLQRPELFGAKTDIVCASLVVGKSVMDSWSKEYWLFLDTRTLPLGDVEIQAVKSAFLPNKCLIDRGLCLHWIEHYRNIRIPMSWDDRQQRKGSSAFGINIMLSDNLGHLHCSAGMFTILYALKHLKPKTLKLYGFDNMQKGTFDWSVTRGPEWNEYPDHNWATEHKMLEDVCKAYHYKLDREEMLCSAL